MASNEEVKRFIRTAPQPRNWSSHAAIHDEFQPYRGQTGTTTTLTTRRYNELLEIEREWLRSLPSM